LVVIVLICLSLFVVVVRLGTAAAFAGGHPSQSKN
jgi:hypothetical protein